MNETTNNDYNPDDDPTPEDGEITPRDELIILAGELGTLQAEDFNFWRANRLARLDKLIREGVNGETFVYRAEPDPNPATEFAADGFSTDGIFVQHATAIDMADRYAESRDRLLEYVAHMIRKERYFLPLDRFADDAEFQARYLKNLGTAAAGPWAFGRSGYKNQPVFESFIAEQVGPHTKYTGVDQIPDHNFPYAGGNHDDIVEIFVNDIESGAYRERMLRVAHNALAEMDRGNMDPWEGYREIPLAWRFDRNAELENARNNPNY